MNNRALIAGVAVLSVLCAWSLPQDVGAASLEEIHKHALAAYREDKSPVRPVALLEAAGIKSIMENRPTLWTDQQYAGILNDYGFFLSETENRWQEAIPVLEKVIKLDAARYVAHLNLGDVYAKAMASTTDSIKQAELSERIGVHYEEYARLRKTYKSGGKLPDRVEAVLNNSKSAGAVTALPKTADMPNKEEGTAEGLTLLATIKDIGLELPLIFDGKHLIYSRYDKTGNSKELVFLDPRTGTIEETFGGLGTFSSHYLFSDPHYVITRDMGEPHRLVVFDRKTKSRLREIKLSQRIAGAFVRGGKLYVTQNNDPYHLSRGGQALTYDLHTGKLLNNVSVIPSNALLLYGDQVILTGYEIRAYDLAFNELGGFPRAPKSRELNSICELGPAKIAGDKLIVGANCGDIAIYNLKTRILERTIPAFDPALFNSLGAVGDILFIAPSSRESLPPNKARIFDLLTGEEKAVLDVSGHFLAVSSDMLITVPEYKWGQGKSNVLAVYRMEKDQLVAKDIRLNKLLAAYEKAKKFDAQGDRYRATDVLNEEGFPALLANGKIEGSLQPIAEDYTRWLADTFHRFAEAIPLIERFRLAHPQEPSWALLLSDVMRKRHDIDGDKRAWDQAIAAYKDYQQLSGQSSQIHRREFVRDKEVITSSMVNEVDIVGGSLPGPISFHQDRAYFPLYGCYQSNAGVSLEVFERQTFQHLQSVPITGCDDDYQDSIGNIQFSKTQIHLSIGYRYESQDRPNVVILDKINLAILEKRRRDLPSSDQMPYTGEPAISVGNGRYEVSNAGGYRLPKLHVTSTSDGQQWDVELPTQDQGEPLSLDHDRFFIAAGIRTFASETRYSVYDLKTRQSVTLARLKPRLRDQPVVATYESLAFIGFGHDLLILDGSSNRIVHFERNYIREEFEDNGHGLDTNRIAMLIVDGDRLIARTFYGNHSRILDLTALKKALGLAHNEVIRKAVENPSFTADFLGRKTIALEDDVPLSTGAGGADVQGDSSAILVQPEYVVAVARIAEVQAGIGKGNTNHEMLLTARGAAQTLLDPQQRARAYMALARTYTQLQQPETAEEVLGRVASSITQLQLPELTTWPKMAQAYANLPGQKNREKANEYILKSHELVTTVHDFVHDAMRSDALVSIAEAEMAAEQHSKARETIREAFKALPGGKDASELRVLSLLNIAAAQGLVEGKNQAGETLQQAVQSARSISSRTTRVQMFAAIAAAQARLGHVQSAQASLVEAQKVGATIKKDRNKDRVSAAIAQAQAALRQFDEAERLLASNHTGTWSYQDAFGVIAKEEARAGELDRAMQMTLRYTTLSESEKIHLVANLADVLLVALQAGVSKKDVADQLAKIVYPRFSELKPFH